MDKILSNQSSSIQIPAKNLFPNVENPFIQEIKLSRLDLVKVNFHLI